MRRAIVLLLSSLSFAACGEALPAPEMPMESAHAAAARVSFWTALHAGRYDALLEVIAQLSDVYDEEPENLQNTLLLGMSHLWRIGEHDRAPSWTTGDSVAEALAAIKYFSELIERDPTDRRIPAWLGSVQVPTAMARGDRQIQKEYVDQLLRASRDYPEVNAFIAAITLAQYPPADEWFRAGVDEMWAKLSLCSEGRITPRAAEISQYPEWQTPTERNRTCWINSEQIPHRFEGLWMSFGDILVKDNQADLAKVLYRNAMATQEYATWAHRGDLEDRIAKADERAALYRDTDPTNDPLLWTQDRYGCVSCHAR